LGNADPTARVTRDNAAMTRGSGRGIELTYVAQMPARNDEHVTRMELPKIDEGHRQIVLADDARRFPAQHDVAEDASVVHQALRAHSMPASAGPRSGFGLNALSCGAWLPTAGHADPQRLQ